jgi:hypothetical protein
MQRYHTAVPRSQIVPHEMAITDSLVYCGGLVVSLLAAYLISCINLEKVRSPTVLYFVTNRKLEGDGEKIKIVRYLEFEGHDDLGPVPGSSYPAGWWTDEKQYRVECRAIFHKASQ